MIRDFFAKEKIEYFATLKTEDITVWDKEKFSRIEEKIGEVKSVTIFLIPYYFGQKTTNLSVYAQGRDYHLYIKELSQRFASFAKEKDPSLSFVMMADTSPLAERKCTLDAGLGVLGKNGLVINEKYGSFVFIGTLFLSKDFSQGEKREAGTCLLCGECEKACPTGAIFDGERKKCLSLISQKKDRTKEEETLLQNAKCKWGCDLCQNVCPMNKEKAFTPIPFFRTDFVESLTEEVISQEKKAFQTRAFSWRGRSILYRNLGIEDEKKKQ